MRNTHPSSDGAGPGSTVGRLDDCRAQAAVTEAPGSRPHGRGSVPFRLDTRGPRGTPRGDGPARTGVGRARSARGVPQCGSTSRELARRDAVRGAAPADRVRGQPFSDDPASGQCCEWGRSRSFLSERGGCHKRATAQPHCFPACSTTFISSDRRSAVRLSPNALIDANSSSLVFGYARTNTEFPVNPVSSTTMRCSHPSAKPTTADIGRPFSAGWSVPVVSPTFRRTITSVSRTSLRTLKPLVSACGAYFTRRSCRSTTAAIRFSSRSMVA